MGRTSFDFRGDVAVVTGSSSGIGRAIAAALAAAGASVHGFDAREPEGAAGAELAGSLAFQQVDLRDTAAVDAAVARVLEREGRIDLLANVAGVARDALLWKLADEDWDAVLDVNLSGAFRALRAVARAMRERRRGSIVNVASINGLRGKAGQASYTASKAGLVALTRTAARELGPRGVRVNAVAPGMIETPMSAALPEAIRQRALEESCLGRIGRPEDVAASTLYLLSDQAAHVTGATLVVDGGQLA